MAIALWGRTRTCNGLLLIRLNGKPWVSMRCLEFELSTWKPSTFMKIVMEYPHPFRFHSQFLLDVISGLGIPIPPLLTTNKSITTLQTFPHRSNLYSSPRSCTYWPFSQTLFASTFFTMLKRKWLDLVVSVMKCFFPVKNILGATMFFFPFIYGYITLQQMFISVINLPGVIMKSSAETMSKR